MNTKILSVGGSIIAPDKPDVGFLTSFIAMIKDWLNAELERRLILVAGGGAPARIYQSAYKEAAARLDENTDGDAADKIGKSVSSVRNHIQEQRKSVRRWQNW